MYVPWTSRHAVKVSVIRGGGWWWCAEVAIVLLSAGGVDAAAAAAAATGVPRTLPLAGKVAVLLVMPI